MQILVEGVSGQKARRNLSKIALNKGLQRPKPRVKEVKGQILKPFLCFILINRMKAVCNEIQC